LYPLELISIEGANVKICSQFYLILIQFHTPLTHNCLMLSKKEHLLKDFLDEKVSIYNQKDFIEKDPISIPHLFRIKQDIEIAGLFAAVLAWGNRTTIIKKCHEILKGMDYQPYEFIKNFQTSDLMVFKDFKHRTFQPVDMLYFLHFLQDFYSHNDSLESAFIHEDSNRDKTVEKALIGFHNIFFSLPDHLPRTKKHISTPLRKSACKRLNMYLRWMVRKDEAGVDFGIWNQIKMSQLVCPCDVHVENVSRKLGLIKRKSMDWETALELTKALRTFDPNDPVKYDFALFGLGLEGFAK